MAEPLPRFQKLASLVDEQGRPTMSFHIWWDTFARTLEGNFDSIESALADIQQLQTDMQTRITEITALQTDLATTVAALADAVADLQIVNRNDSISASATAPSSILTGSDAGSDATISILAHDRIYGDGVVRAIDAGSITGLAYSTTYAVYYDDVDRTAGTKTFVATTTLKDAQYNVVAGRHFCGQVTTPASGGGDTSGGPGIPGGGGPYP